MADILMSGSGAGSTAILSTMNYLGKHRESFRNALRKAIRIWDSLKPDVEDWDERNKIVTKTCGTIAHSINSGMSGEVTQLLFSTIFETLSPICGSEVERMRRALRHATDQSFKISYAVRALESNNIRLLPTREKVGFDTIDMLNYLGKYRLKLRKTLQKVLEAWYGLRWKSAKWHSCNEEVIMRVYSIAKDVMKNAPISDTLEAITMVSRLIGTNGIRRLMKVAELQCKRISSAIETLESEGHIIFRY